MYSISYKIINSINNWINNCYISNQQMHLSPWNKHHFIISFFPYLLFKYYFVKIISMIILHIFCLKYIQHPFSDLPRSCCNGSLPGIFPATGKDHKRESEPGRQSWPLFVHVWDRGWYRANGDRKSKVCWHTIRDSADPRLCAV